MTLTEKLLARAAGKAQVQAGDNIWVNADVLMTHDICGPGTIGVMAYRAAKSGWRDFLEFVAFISLNLAVLNALPIPFLDGGHAAILLFEKLRRKDLSIQVKERILMGGFIFLMGFMVFVVVLDILRFRH